MYCISTSTWLNPTEKLPYPRCQWNGSYWAPSDLIQLDEVVFTFSTNTAWLIVRLNRMAKWTWSSVPPTLYAWQSQSRQMVARYACIRGWIDASSHLLRSLVLNTRWIMTWLSDCGIRVIYLLELIYETGRWPATKFFGDLRQRRVSPPITTFNLIHIVDLTRRIKTIRPVPLATGLARGRTEG